MLPGVQINGHEHHSIDSVDDIPLFIVLVFELLSAENIPPEMKPFTTLTSRAQTIQRIIDTLEEVSNGSNALLQTNHFYR